MSRYIEQNCPNSPAREAFPGDSLGGVSGEGTTPNYGEEEEDDTTESPEPESPDNGGGNGELGPEGEAEGNHVTHAPEGEPESGVPEAEEGSPTHPPSEGGPPEAPPTEPEPEPEAVGEPEGGDAPEK